MTSNICSKIEKGMGRIDLITGPMFSGKSSELIKIIKRYQVLDKKILIVNHTSDNRYNENSITTHNKVSVDCICIEQLFLLKNDSKYNYDTSEIIVIEEAQFFANLYDFVKHAADIDNKTIIVAGLDGDSNRNMFGEILKLVPISDTITKLHALCIKCKNGTPGIFSKRLVNISSQVLVGVDEYIPVCRHHYHN